MAFTAEKAGPNRREDKKKYKTRKQSQAPVALIYFITLLVFLGVFGWFAKTIVDKLTHHKTEDNTAATAFIDSYNTLYARVNNGDVLSDLFVLRICPEHDKMICVPLSALTVSPSNNNMTFREVYENGGIRDLQAAVDSTLGISTDFYATLSNSAFEDICDIIGGFTYAPEQEIYFIDKKGDEDISLRENKPVSLSGKQIRMILQHSVFSNGRQGNMEFLGTTLTELINNAFDQVDLTTSSLDIIYGKISANSATNLSENDYKEHRAYIKDMLAKQISPAECMLPEGTWNDSEHFTISAEYKQKLYDAMEATKSQSKSGKKTEE